MSLANAQAPACPSHLEAAAFDTCARCGRFVCAACAGGRTPPRCPDCAAREPVALLPDSGSLGRLPFAALKLYARALPWALLISAALATLTAIVDRLFANPTPPALFLNPTLMLLVELAGEVATLMVFRRALALASHPSPWRLARALVVPVSLSGLLQGVGIAVVTLIVTLSRSIDHLAMLNKGAVLLGELLIEPTFWLYACVVLLVHPGRSLATLWRWTHERRMKVLGLATACVAAGVMCERTVDAVLGAVLPAPSGLVGTALDLARSVVGGGLAALSNAGLVALVCWLSATARDGGAAPTAEQL